MGDLLDVPANCAEALLRHTGWSSEKLMEAFWSDGAGLREKVGVAGWERCAAGGAESSKKEGDEDEAQIALPAAEGEQVTCRICFSDVAAEDTRGPTAPQFFLPTGIIPARAHTHTRTVVLLAPARDSREQA